ncbi:Eukaryotic translation initiation factor 4 gamma 1 [Takifugu flavidus]|uniref:Eukaryotic translation initiation factor 4 gamma 1 n=1 Tax=Takifugu flavidus TaxID=433684 RepID=A0A5C6MVV2_9TELE|nr:Eukaryotic translation initiation factor 4 gamma 1 [Takifugu flavidus]
MASSGSDVIIRGEAAEEEVKTQDVLKQVQGILDKLTPQNFSDLMKYLSELEINTELRFRSIIELVLPRSYCPASADMCHYLMTLNVVSEKMNFHKLLLRRCQKEFDNIQNKEAVQNEEAHFQARRPSLRNVTLIGELFNLQMVEEANCVVSLQID